MSMMTATLDDIGSKPNSRSMWRQFVSLMEGPTPTAQNEISRYLARHSHDLPAQVFVELERHRFAP